MAGQRELREMTNSQIDQINACFDQLNSSFDELNRRLDRLFFAILGIGAAQITAQIALLVTLIVRT